MRRKLLTICCCGLLAACSSSRYQISNDHAPDYIPQLDEISDAVPVQQPYSRHANKDYRVRGVDYKVWRDITELTQSGKASWYGKKFHGHKTSNGEIYDMFSMSAAHKNLPLPSFVKVTNTGNDRSVIVRVNDRGPFHSERIIDLSYAAAYKLDMLKSGTADVRVELIMPRQENNTLFTKKPDWFIQILASSSASKAQNIAEKLGSEYKVSNRLVAADTLHRVQLGPIGNISEAEALLLIIQQKYKNAYLFKELPSQNVSN
ncbi:MAG: rare lipoprotein A [Moritella sp.]|jgi:rare lipoprotein A